MNLFSRVCFILGISVSVGACVYRLGDPPRGEIVGPEGGIVEGDDGVVVTIPPGALDRDVDISIERLAEPPAFAIGPAFDLQPDGLEFTVPITVRLPVNAPPANMEWGLLAVYAAPSGTDAFEMLAAEVVDGFAEAETTHFSEYVPGLVAATVLATGEHFPQGVASDGTRVFWANAGNTANMIPNRNNGFVMSAPVRGGPVTELSPELEDPSSVAVDATHVYWTSGGHGLDMTGSTGSAVLRMPKSGGAVETLIDATYATGMTIDANRVYYTDSDDGEVRAIGLDGSNPQILASGLDYPHSVAVSDTAVCWADSGADAVACVDGVGQPVITVASGQADPFGLAIAGGFLYWANEGDGGVFRAELPAGAPELVFQAERPLGLAVDGDTVYFTDGAMGRVLQVAGTGGVATILAEGQPFPWYVHLPGDGTLVWSNAGHEFYQGQIAVLTLP